MFISLVADPAAMSVAVAVADGDEDRGSALGREELCITSA